MSTQLDAFDLVLVENRLVMIPHQRRRPVRTAPESAPAVLSDASAYCRHYAEVYRIARRSEAARRHDAKKLTLTELERAAMRHKADAHALVAEQALTALIRRTQP